MMKQRYKSRKRPCRICRKWFSANPRVGDRQKTCGAQDCQDKWHAKKCAEWNSKNPSYFREIYLSKKLASVASAETGNPQSPPVSKSNFICRQSSEYNQLPRNLIQEVIGAQHLVIIEYVAQLLLRPFQEETKGQLFKITRKLQQLPHAAFLRGDSAQRGP